MAYYGILFSIIILVGGAVFLAAVLLARVWRAAGELIYPARRLAATAPTDYGVRAEPVSFPTAGGLILRGWFASADERARGTIVFSHGYAGDCSPDMLYVPFFNGAGYNVLLFDYRGHGASDGTSTSLVYFERGDLLAALDYLRSRGIERVGLMGFSMGGAITLSTAPLSPMVVGAVSDSTFGELKCIISNAAVERGASPWLAGLIGFLVEAFACLRLRANLFSADPIHWVGRIAPRPVLLMHGEKDEAIPVSEVHRLFHAAREPKELWTVPGANHRQLDALAPDEYRRRVIEFFDRAFQSLNPST